MFGFLIKHRNHQTDKVEKQTQFTFAAGAGAGDVVEPSPEDPFYIILRTY